MSEGERRTLRFPYVIGRPFLAGYDGVREEKSITMLVDVMDWKHRIYLPPARLAAKAERPKFTWKHDVYSLGVVLLEIALWEDFTDIRGRMGKRLKDSSNMPIALMECVKQVPRILGEKYGDAVRACLRMLQDEEEFSPFHDEDGVLMGTSYISQVMSKLEDINV